MKLESAEIALRTYVTHGRSLDFGVKPTQAAQETDLVVVIDTETTADTYLNLLFGSFGVWVSGRLHRLIVLHSDRLSKRELQLLTTHAKKLAIERVNVELMPLERFIDEVFYPYVYDAHARLIGFNLPFDISRLALRYGIGRGKRRNSFRFILSKNRFRSPIRITSLDSTKAFIEFYSPPRRNQRYSKQAYKGRFVDLRTLGFALTNEKLTLESACELFHAQRKKMKANAHGRITPEYVDYNINDSLATYAAYIKMIKRYDAFHLALPYENVYSPATIGKQYLKQIGIKPFLEQNPQFPPVILGCTMTAYYGGRSEVRIRKKSVKVRYLDFTSLYPSLLSIIGLWSNLTAERIRPVEATKEIRSLVANANLETLRSPALWREMIAIVQVQPNQDILPVRAPYGDKHLYKIGINNVTSTRPLWYALPDVIASKILTGQPPKMIRAVKFVPSGRQAALSPIQMVDNSIVHPNEDLFLKLRQLRRSSQSAMKLCGEASGEYDAKNAIQEELKIIANATSYGIFIEVNTEEGECQVDVYGLGHLKCEVSKKETFGRFFHPIIATILTSGARLLLALAEAWLIQHRGYYAFCDTDSIAVSPFHWRKLQQTFEPLNPLPGEPFLKLEKENYDAQGRLRELWFYGISAKRYALYILDEKGEPVPVKWSSHGIGHLKHEKRENWEQELWTNILRNAHGKISKSHLLSQYSNEHAVAELTLTNPQLFRRVKAINRGEAPSQKIKPYNFVLVGSPTMTGRKGIPIIPVTKYVRPYHRGPYQPFIDAKTGKQHGENTQIYWKKLDKTIEEYVDHPETKFQNGSKSGRMHRRHLSVDAVAYIGKEANELDVAETLGLNDPAYVEYTDKRSSERI